MLNGALTLGTLDGANVEIVEEVGNENAFIFGMTAEEVIRHEQNGDYDPKEIVRNDDCVRRVLMQLINGTYSPQDENLFRPLYDTLVGRDPYFILKDFRAYDHAHIMVEKAYRDQDGWLKSSIINIAKSGKFSSDRTIQEYVDEIWHLDKLEM